MTEVERWLRKNHEALEAILAVLLRIEKQRGHAFRFRLELGPVRKRKLLQGIPMPPVTIADDEHDSITITPVDAANNEVPFTFTPENPVVWTTSDSTIMTVSANADGSNVDVETTGKLGEVTITAIGTNPDSTLVKGSQVFDVVTSTPQSFRMNVGTPQKK
jgi:hypothetical protein